MNVPLISTIKQLLQCKRDERLVRLRAEHYEQRRPAFHAPYSIKVFEQFLSQVKDRRKTRFLPFTCQPETQRGVSRWYLRFDIDTADCARNMSMMLEASMNAGVPASAFLLFYGNPYDVTEMRDEIQTWRKRGVEIGLHTCCYTRDDYMTCFREECEMFTKLLGFAPRSFTVHGLGDVQLDIRNRFYREIAPAYQDFGFVATDIPGVRDYHHVFHDCWLDESGRRTVYNDMVELPAFVAANRTYAVLVHPCYWIP